MSELILLAGGRSSRLGQPKGLVRVDGRPWLAHQLEAAAAAGVERVVLVLGYWSEQYLGERAEWDVVGSLRLEVAVNPHPERGSFSSLQCGAARASGGAFVLPIDVPCPGREVFEALSRGARAAAAAGPGDVISSAERSGRSSIQVAVPVHAGRGGHPILASAEFLRALLSIDVDAPEARLDVQIRALGSEAIARVAVADARVARNLNTPEDWAAERGLLKNRAELPSR